ncbi:recombination directionality factor [Ramlibacter sp. AN1133]|uniref:recombination directionality factor n=1 Tax=Ramlibacter sp. AN1133 TaxID=3133429 RepID=UPI0030C09A75
MRVSMEGTGQAEIPMDLNTIALTPHALGFIKVACDDDALFGEARTRNEFLITQRHHEACDGQSRLAAHPLREKLACREGDPGKVTEVPIRLFFNRTSNAIAIKYQAYSTPGNVPVCAGDGRKARRIERAADNTQVIAELPCPGPELCELVRAEKAICRRQVRMSVQIDGQNDPLSVFEVRTSSLNSYRALKSQLLLIERRFGGLRHVPLKLTLWQASNEASGFEAFSLMRLVLDAPSEAEAMKAVTAARKELQDAGINDDIDAILSDEGAAEAFAGASMEFQAVRECYAEGTRRAGAEKVCISPSAPGAAEQPRMPLAQVAAAAIQNAMQLTRPAAAEAA